MLTPQQQTALRTFVAADAVLSAIPQNSDGAYALSDALKVIPSPAFVVWKTTVSIDEIMRNGMDWARVDNLSVGKARIWDWMGRLGSFDASRINIRAGIDAAWVGTAADLAVRAQVYIHCKRAANILEKLFATGTGSDASPATMAVEGSIHGSQLKDEMGW